MANSEQETKRPSIAGQGRPSSNRISIVSTGRGGAGNIGSDKEKSSTPSADSLKTPLIKNEHYTTGRGGTGNMAYNHPAVPEMARASQDVTVPPVRQDAEGTTSVRHGRGGAANIAKAVDNGENGVAVTGMVPGASGEKRGREGKERRPSQGWAEKGREMLGQLRSKSGLREGK